MVNVVLNNNVFDLEYYVEYNLNNDDIEFFLDFVINVLLIILCLKVLFDNEGFRY